MSDIEDLFLRVGDKLGWLNGDEGDGRVTKTNKVKAKPLQKPTPEDVVILSSDSEEENILASSGSSSANNSDKENSGCTKNADIVRDTAWENDLSKSSSEASHEELGLARSNQGHTDVFVISSNDANDEESLETSDDDDDYFSIPLKERLYRTCPQKKTTSRLLDDDVNTNSVFRAPPRHWDASDSKLHQNELQQQKQKRTYRHQKQSIIDSDSSEDDDDDFENFVASLKTPKRTIQFRKTGTPVTPFRKPKELVMKKKHKQPSVNEPKLATPKEAGSKVTTAFQGKVWNAVLSSKPRNSDGEFLASLSSGGDRVNPTIHGMYVRDFKKNREELTTKLFALFNKSVFDNKLPCDMNITWNCKMRKTAGFCYNGMSRSKQRSVRIELADKVCDSAERLRDTLIHELCHAAAWYINGVKAGHGPHWKYWTRKANMIHSALPTISRCHSYEINTKYNYQCIKCKYQIGRHSKSLDTDKYRCGYCGGQFHLLAPMKKDGTPAKTRTPNKFALFVKENYSTVKSKRKSLRHADVMRLLSAEFSSKANVSC